MSIISSNIFSVLSPLFQYSNYIYIFIRPFEVVLKLTDTLFINF